MYAVNDEKEFHCLGNTESPKGEGRHFAKLAFRWNEQSRDTDVYASGISTLTTAIYSEERRCHSLGKCSVFRSKFCKLKSLFGRNIFMKIETKI